MGDAGNTLANVIFATIQDRRGRTILSVRDQNTFDEGLRQRRLMTLLHLFLIHRYKVFAIHYLTPTDDNERQTQKMKDLGIFSQVTNEVGGSSLPTSTARASPSSSNQVPPRWPP